MHLKHTFIVAALSFSSLGLVACQSQPKVVHTQIVSKQPANAKINPLPVIKSKDGVQDKQWVIQQIDGKKALFFNQMPTLMLRSSNQRIVGHTGCNMMTGTYTLDVAKRQMKLKAQADHMPCENALAQEATLMDALFRVEYFQVKGNQITLYDANRQALLEGISQ